MKEKMLQYIDNHIAYCQHERIRLQKEFRNDEAAHQQIAMNVYGIFRSIYQAMQYDMGNTLQRFSKIVEEWDQQHQQAAAHEDRMKALIEEIKISRALELIAHAKEMECIQND